ncbi:MAG: DUF4230 domain-containing protein [Limisphaerales bacterium]
MNKSRLAIVGGVVLGLVLLCLALGFVLIRWIDASGSPRPLNTATLLTQIQGLSQLVTVKYVLEKVVVLEDVKIYGENRVILVAHGVVKAGVDLSRLTPGDVSTEGSRVRVRLPMAGITDVYLDESQTQVLEHSTGLLRRFDKDLQQSARREGMEAIRRNARYTGIVDDANERAREQLTVFFQQLGFENVEFVP